MRDFDLTYPERLYSNDRFGQQHAKNVQFLTETALRKYSLVERDKLLQGLFIDKTVGVSDDPDENSLTKEELAVLLELKGYGRLYENLGKLSESRVSASEILARDNGSRALHLVSQLSNQSTDKKTEIFSQIQKYNNGIYLVRGYKHVGTNYFKFEITKARIGEATSMDKRATALGSLKLMKKLLDGIEECVLPCYLHNKDFTPLYAFL